MIHLRGLTKGFGASSVLNAIDLDIPPGQFVALLGPSGSGKTTLLRILSGLEIADTGSITLNGHAAAALPPGARNIGFVFQSYALFGHLSAFENIAFGLRVRPRRSRPSEPEIRRRVEDLLAMVHLDGLGPRLPAQLSGGQRQRIALARALAIEPRILLLDEPFGALDQHVRASLRTELRRLHDTLGLTTVFVTHDQDEALELADRIITLERGRIARDMAPVAGTPTRPRHVKPDQ